MVVISHGNGAGAGSDGVMPRGEKITPIYCTRDYCERRVRVDMGVLSTGDRDYALCLKP